MAERLWSSRDLNFIFSTSLNVSKTTAKSYKKGDRNDNKKKITSVWPVWTHAERITGQFLKAFQYQIHDEIELYGEVNNEEHTGPAVLGVCWHHHIRETTKKELTWDKKMTHDALKAELQPAECMPINIKDVTSHTVQFCWLKSITCKISPIFKEFWNEPTGTESWGLHQVLLNILSCGQEHEQTNETVFQCAEVLQSERYTHTLKKNKKGNNTEKIKSQHTGSEELVEKRQKPGRTNTE